MRLLSPAFQENERIPSLYTCEGKNVNPPLEIFDIPSDAKSLVLIMDDPDVPSYIRADQVYDHWILFNLPPHTRHIGENSSPLGMVGQNSSGENKYIGPCPPDREHRYFFKLYALNRILNLPAGTTKKELENAMRSHIIAQCELIGRYEKRKL